MECAKILAKKSDYVPNALSICDDGDHKLEYRTPVNKIVKFGKVDYNDFIIWNWLEIKGEVANCTANRRRMLYHRRSDNMNGNWKTDKYSANNLARLVIW